MLNTQENRKIWMKAAEENRDLLEGRVKDGIEKNRKGYCKLKFTDKDGNPIKGKKVKITQMTHDFGFGANLFMLDEFDTDEYNKIYRDNFKKYFNLATVPFYWKDLEPEKGNPRYDKNSPKVYRRPAPDLCMEYCEENGITPKLHCLVYETWLPDWLPKDDMAKTEELYAERFRQISERYSGRMKEFEVINECHFIPCWEKTRSVICDKKSIIDWSFRLAEKYFPNDLLVINEGNPIESLAKERYYAQYYLLIEKALKNGRRIEKIGLQHHVFTGVSAENEQEFENAVKKGDIMVDPATILKGLDVIADFGLPLEITEVTVPCFGDTEEDEELQADLLELLYSVWFSHPAVEDVVYWNAPDGYAYAKKGWNENLVRGGLWHHDLTPKKAALRLHKLINEVWHTDLELTTDENGYVDFRGFYGEYIAETDTSVADFHLHKNDCRTTEIIL